MKKVGEEIYEVKKDFHDGFWNSWVGVVIESFGALFCLLLLGGLFLLFVHIFS